MRLSSMCLAVCPGCEDDSTDGLRRLSSCVGVRQQLTQQLRGLHQADHFTVSPALTDTVELAGRGARSRVERIDPLRFLARCRKSRLNHTLSVLSLSLDF